MQYKRQRVNLYNSDRDSSQNIMHYTTARFTHSVAILVDLTTKISGETARIAMKIKHISSLMASSLAMELVCLIVLPVIQSSFLNYN